MKGVISVLPGYSGGQKENPTYEEVCTGTTGHAEVCHIEFDREQVSFLTLLEVLFKTHDPTTLNRQGGDIGTQYRSAIFYHNEEQKAWAEQTIAKLIEEKVWNDPIVTTVEAFTKFYRAENYHENYFANNPNQPYCSAVVRPKVEKFKKAFSELLK